MVCYKKELRKMNKTEGIQEDSKRIETKGPVGDLLR